MAIDDAHLKKSDIRKAGVLMGTTLGESPLIERMNECLAKDDFESIAETSVFLYPTNSIPVNIALEIGAEGYNAMFPTACASGNYAIGYGFDLIRRGQADIVFAGASDAFSRIAFTGFNRLMAMAPEKCQPFDKYRKGMMLGEGAGVLILESLKSAEKRVAKVYAEILGYGLSCDAHHMTQPSEEGIIRCLKIALNNAGITSREIDYISAHGTGTPQNDWIECSSLRKTFHDSDCIPPCSSIKSMLGHTMGAASALESISCSLSLKYQIVPPTINFINPDGVCNIDCIPSVARKESLRFVLNNSFAFGGNNSCLILCWSN